jgi:xylan 1,4-beta-xylosidase
MPLPHVWEHTVGSCHAPLGLRADWQGQLRRCRQELGFRHVRFHGPLYYTEWNVSSNPRYPRQDEPYAAAFVVKTVLETARLVDCYSFWTFSDLFEENYFPSAPFHGGFGLLSLHGIPKPTYRAFELLHRLGQEQLPVEGGHETVDAWAVRRGESLTLLLTNHALPRQPIEAQCVQIELAEVPAPRAVWLERIDEGHANAKAAWLALGQPEYPDSAALVRLDEASRLVRQSHPWDYEGQTVRLEVNLPPHAVAALTVEFPAWSLTRELPRPGEVTGTTSG